MDTYSPKGFEFPPFGIPMIWGKKSCGKTIAALNSPWGPVHVLDSEYSSYDYYTNVNKMIEMKILRYPFTRAECGSWADFEEEIKRIETDKLQFGTIVIDTSGQVGEWIKGVKFYKAEKVTYASGGSKADKQTQIVWGEIRSELRLKLISLRQHCKLVILTAHETEYNKVFSPRANPAVMELAAMSFHLVRQPNDLLPNAVEVKARLPIFPPRIDKFSLIKLLNYFEKPADYDHLKPEEMATVEIPRQEEKPLTDEQQEALNG